MAMANPNYLAYYRKGRQIGKGAQGTVFKYKKLKQADGNLPSKITVKEGLDLRKSQSRRELEILQGIQHQHIVQYLFHQEVKGGLAFLAMELCDSNLDKFLEKRGGFNLFEVSEMMTQLLSAKNYLDQREIIHRDIKPSNILVNYEADSSVDMKSISVYEVNLKLADFGLARPYPGSQTMTAVGTLLYAAPEIKEAFHKQDPSLEYDNSVDNFSLGMIAYCLYSGEPLRSVEERSETLRKMENHEVTDEKGFNQFLHRLMIERKAAREVLENDNFLTKPIEGKDIFFMIKRNACKDLSHAVKNVLSQDESNENGKSFLTFASGLSTEAVRILIEEGEADVNKPDSNGDTALICASASGNEGLVKTLVQTWQADPDLRGSGGFSPLMIAARLGHLNVVKVLVAFGQARLLDAEDHLGWTSLHHAAMHDQADIVDCLAQAGANVNYTDINGNTPLHLAAEYGCKNALANLVDLDTSTSAKNCDGNLAIHLAAAAGIVSALKELLRVDPASSINEFNKIGHLPLHEAVRNNHIEACRFLHPLTGRNCKGFKGQTPLHVASLDGHKQMVQVLLSLAEDPHIQDENGSILFESAAHNGSVDIMEVLFMLDASMISVCNLRGQRPLHVAAGRGNIDAVSFLVAKGAFLDATDESGQTPLCEAVLNGQIEVSKFLIEEGAGLQHQNEFGKSALHIACEIGNLSLVELLCKNCDDKKTFLFLKDEKDRTCFHLAALAGHLNVVDALQTFDPELSMAGLNPKLFSRRRDADGNLALHLACANGHKNVVERLAGYNVTQFFRNNSSESASKIAQRNGYPDIVHVLKMTKEVFWFRFILFFLCFHQLYLFL